MPAAKQQFPQEGTHEGNHRLSVKTQKQSGVKNQREKLRKKSSTFIDRDNKMLNDQKKLSTTMVSKDFQECRFDKASIGKLEVGSQDAISDSSKLTYVRQDIGSPVMRKSNLGALRNRRGMIRRKQTRNLIKTTSKDDNAAKVKDPSVSSNSGYSKRITQNEKNQSKKIIQRHQTVTAEVMKKVDAGLNRAEPRKSELPNISEARLALQIPENLNLQNNIDALSLGMSSGFPKTVSSKSILTSVKNQESPEGRKSNDEASGINARARNLKVSQYRQLTQDMFLQLYRIQDFTNEYEEVPKEKEIDFKFTRKGMDKLLLFDLDETLIHVWRGLGPERFEPEEQIMIKHYLTGEEEKWGLSVRPFVRECLEFANKHFEVGVFTASHQCFAEQVIDFLDPKKELIHHRYYNQHARLVEDDEDTFVVKDLNIFKGEVNLDNILIVDNNIYSFAFQLENGIPILDFVGDPCDTELLKVRETLNHLKGFSNLRQECEKTFRLREIHDQDMALFIHYYDSEGWSDDPDKDFDDDGRTEHRTVSYKKGYGRSDRVAEDDQESEEESNIDRVLSVCSSVDQANFNKRSQPRIHSPSSFSPGGQFYGMELQQLNYGVSNRPKSPNPGTNIGIKVPLNQSIKSNFMQLKVLQHSGQKFSQFEQDLSDEEDDAFVQTEHQNPAPSAMSQGSPNHFVQPQNYGDKPASSLDVQIQLPAQIDLTFDSKMGVQQESQEQRSDSNSDQSPESQSPLQQRETTQQLPSFRNEIGSDAMQNQICSVNRIEFQVSTSNVDNSPLSQLVNHNFRQAQVQEIEIQVVSQEYRNLQVPQANSSEVQRVDQVESGSSGGTPSLEVSAQNRLARSQFQGQQARTMVVNENSERNEDVPHAEAQPSQMDERNIIAPNGNQNNQRLTVQKQTMPEIRVSPEQSFDYKRVGDSEAPSELEHFDGQPSRQDQVFIETDSILKHSEFESSPQIMQSEQTLKGNNRAQDTRLKQKADKMKIQLNQVKADIPKKDKPLADPIIKLQMTQSPQNEELKLTDPSPPLNNDHKVKEYQQFTEVSQESDDGTFQINSSQVPMRQESEDQKIGDINPFKPVSYQQSSSQAPIPLNKKQKTEKIHEYTEKPIDIKNGRQSISQNALPIGRLNILKNQSKKRPSAMQSNPSTITAPNWDVRRQTYERRQRRRLNEERQRGNSLPIDKMKSFGDNKGKKGESSSRRKGKASKKKRSGQSEVTLYRYCVNIDNKLDKLFSEMDKHWKQGSMKNDIMKHNPNIKPEFIIEPKLFKQNKSHQEKVKKNLSIVPKNSEEEKQMSVKAPDNLQIGNSNQESRAKRDISLLTVPKQIISSQKNHSANKTFQISPKSFKFSQYGAMTNVPASVQKLSAFKTLSSPKNKSFLFSDSKARMDSLLNIDRAQTSQTTAKKRSNTIIQSPFSQNRESSQNADEENLQQQKLREYYGSVCSESGDYFNFNQVNSGFPQTISALQSMGGNQRSRVQNSRMLTASNFLTPVKQINQSLRNGPGLSSYKPIQLQKSQTTSQNKN